MKTTSLVCVSLLLALLLIDVGGLYGRQITFSGCTWDVGSNREEGPGWNPNGPCTPGVNCNFWDDSEQNVWVDESGRLHLALRHDEQTDRWYCSGVSSVSSFGYGRYLFWVDSRIDNLDPRVVAGLFTYEAPDCQNELDFEFSTWDALIPWNNGQFVTWANGGSCQPNCCSSDADRFLFFLNGDYTTHVLDWDLDQNGNPRARFQSWHGHYLSDPGYHITDERTFYYPDVPADAQERVMFNLWLTGAPEPRDQYRTHELIISNFMFFPADNAPPQFTTCRVSPPTGTPTTPFQFFVTYQDDDNQSPDVNSIRLYVDGAPDPNPMIAGGSNWATGVEFHSATTRTFNQGVHQYHFTGTQGSYNLRYPATGEFNFTVQPPGATYINVTAGASPNPCTVYESVTVSGTATYNNGMPVTNGTATVSIASWGTWTCPVGSGSFSTIIQAPGQAATYTVNVAVSDGQLSGAQNISLVVQQGSPAGQFTFQRSTTCENVQGAPNYDPIGETPAFNEFDTRVYVWVHLTYLYVPVRLRWVWHRPDGTTYGTYTSGWTTDPQQQGYEYWNWWKLWSWLNIQGYDVSDLEGQWTVDLYSDVGNGFQYLTSEDFVIRYDFVEHLMCQNVQSSDPWNPINPTNIFYQNNTRAYTWMKAEVVSIPMHIRWDWYEPNGTQYFTFSLTSNDPGGSYFDWVKAWGWIDIAGANASSRTGNWQVRVFVQDPWNNWDQEYTDYFQILESPGVNPQVSVTPSPLSPLEGQPITLTLNATDNTYLNSAALQWVDGGPHSQSWNNLNTSSLTQAVPIGAFSEGQQVIYWGTARDNSNNFTETVHAILPIGDTDTQGPIISAVFVSEYNGNGNGVIETNEQVRIEWSLTDPSGIQSTSLTVDGENIPVQGSYFGIAGPLQEGPRAFTIYATDNDYSPGTSSYHGTFDVSGPPNSVDDLVVQAEPNGVDLSLHWSPSSTATTYRIHASDNSLFEPSSENLLATISGTDYTELGGLGHIQRFYVVIAVRD